MHALVVAPEPSQQTHIVRWPLHPTNHSLNFLGNLPKWTSCSEHDILVKSCQRQPLLDCSLGSEGAAETCTSGKSILPMCLDIAAGV